MAKAKFEVKREHSWQSAHFANRESDKSKVQSEKWNLKLHFTKLGISEPFVTTTIGFDYYIDN
jgi:hypothetical protein